MYLNYLFIKQSQQFSSIIKVGQVTICFSSKKLLSIELIPGLIFEGVVKAVSLPAPLAT